MPTEARGNIGQVKPTGWHAVKYDKMCIRDSLYGGAKERAREMGVEKIHVSITNTEEYAQAFAVAESYP